MQSNRLREKNALNNVDLLTVKSRAKVRKKLKRPTEKNHGVHSETPDEKVDVVYLQLTNFMDSNYPDTPEKCHDNTYEIPMKSFPKSVQKMLLDFRRTRINEEKELQRVRDEIARG